jgi:catecholate siderophore receptor
LSQHQLPAPKAFQTFHQYFVTDCHFAPGEHMKLRIKRAKSRRRRGPRYWIVAVGTMGVLVAQSAGPSHAITLTRAPNVQAKVTASQQQTQLRYDIPPGTLEAVLAAFQKVSGVSVNIPNDAMRTLSSQGVSGYHSPESALKQILAGTSVTYRFTDAMTATIELQSLEGSVEIRDEGPRLTSPKYTEPLRDTPQTITVINKEVIEQQGATTLRDVLKNVPGLTITAGEGGTPAGDNLTLRGFSARNDIFIDGVRDLSPQSRDPFNLEEVNVVKGPGSVYTGRGSAGGSINLINKVPFTKGTFAGTLDFGADETVRGTGDINLPLNDSMAFRLNFLAHNSGVAGRDVVNYKRWGVAPSLSFGLNTSTRYIVSYYKLKQNNISDYGIPWVPNTNNALVAFRDRPAPVPRNTFYGLRDRDNESLNSDLFTFRVEHDFNDALAIRNQFRFSRASRDSIATPPRFANNNSTAINREMRAWITRDDAWDNQSDFTAKFETGGIEHSLVAGVDLTRETNIRKTRTAPNMATTLLNPNPDDVFTGVITTSPIVGDITANSQALYAFDTAKLGSKWELMGGVRWDRFDADGISTTGTPVTRVDRMLSFRAGTVFKPRPEGSIYASYGTALNPSLEGLSYNTANTVIDPEKTYTFEVGTKWDILGGRVLLSGAAFRVDKTNARTPGLVPGDPPQVLEGQQRVSGVELSMSGSLTRKWDLLAGYTFLDSETVDSNTAPTLVNGVFISEVGKDLVNTPRNSFNLWTTYRVSDRLAVGGGTRFVGKRFGNTINTRFVDSYWTFDLMTSYELSNHLDLKLNLYNLTNTYYFDRLGGGHVIPGPGRSASISTSFRF